MTSDGTGPVLFAYDGSDLAGNAIAEAGRQLLADRDAVVLTVWEPFNVGFLPLAGMECIHSVTHNLPLDSKPITAVTPLTDGVAQVTLALIVKSNDVRIGRKGRLMLVFDSDSRPRKNEAIVIGRSRILKPVIIPVTAKCTDTYQT